MEYPFDGVVPRRFQLNAQAVIFRKIDTTVKVGKVGYKVRL